jgi:hypothetical protein
MRIDRAERIGQAYTRKTRQWRDSLLHKFARFLGYKVRAWEFEIHKNAKGQDLRLTKIALSD